MKRRVFLKGLSLITMSALFPSLTNASTAVDLSSVEFSSSIFNTNEAQTIMIYLYGGASELGGNLSNLDEVQEKSQNPYDLSRVTKTSNNFWQQAGGEAMERMLANGDMNVFRTCYRKDHETRAHGICTSENQRGLLDVDDPSYGAGIFSTLGKVLANSGSINAETILPFLTMEGESGLFSTGPFNVEAYLRPAGFNENLSNPYERDLNGKYHLHTNDEWSQSPRPSDPQISVEMDALAKRLNEHAPIQNAFNKRTTLDSFMQEQNEVVLPDGIEYPDTTFGKKMKATINVLIGNPDTRVVSVGGGGLGGWDDHSDAISEYSDRMTDLMNAIEVSLEHLAAKEKRNVNIIVFSEFGRNVNLNDSEGWDHGNNQNVFIFGGQQYFNHVGIVGETQLEPIQDNNRLYTQPKDDSYTFEPYAVAATIYKMYGVTNPEVLTKGYGAIDGGLFK
ncbi:MAG: Unknown protein [uncultured Sulfurovum sp.]|uniref:DUF1501 domain-containing protein n=1 Tax=uncultured Sulfurovum sp. TaxID=269237 RepID=A0A6S6U746_9BACT|nr:MAG: Unknown protein [uncultured Sulfurovum sp.]